MINFVFVLFDKMVFSNRDKVFGISFYMILGFKGYLKIFWKLIL